MKNTLFTLSIFILVLIVSCNKETSNKNMDVVGNWIWKSSLSSNGAQMRSTHTTAIFSIQFKNDNSFVNQATCITGGPTIGNYQLQNFNSERIIILTAANTRPDTLKLAVVSNKLTLTETNNGYAWYHSFDKN